ncbi:MAG: RHS repeat-associated core domain-containing protein, partial [Ktedonobacteraceae bacterium]
GQALTINTTESDRGYTGQEGLDAVQLDDYNARLYDPALGRFLSVDPLIGHPESTQGINPYSYVENNPLSRTDPTGETGTGPSCSGSGDNQVCQTVDITYKNGKWTSNVPNDTKLSNVGQINIHLPGGKAGALASLEVASVFGAGPFEKSTTANNAKNNPSDHTKINIGPLHIESRGKLTDSQEDDFNYLVKQTARYAVALMKWNQAEPGSLDAKQGLNEFGKTTVVFDPKYDELPISYIHGGEGAHNGYFTDHGSGRTKLPGHDEIILGDRIIRNIRNPYGKPVAYAGAQFTPGPNGLLDFMSHEFGHTIARDYRQGGIGIEPLANKYMEELRSYYPSQMP